MLPSLSAPYFPFLEREDDDYLTMKRMERYMVTGPVYKHFDLERKNARWAEARLSQRLQGLEHICLYHMKLLTWEQRQLQKELQRLQQGGQKHRVPQANKVRALATNSTQGIYKIKSQMPPFDHAGLRDSVKSKEQSLSQNYKASHFTAEKPQAREKDCLRPPKGKDSNKGISILCQDQDVSINTLDQGPGSSPAGGRGKAHTDEARSQDANLKPDPNAGRQSPLNPRERAGNLKHESITPTFLELFVKVRNAHYLQHRVPPESERLLSIGEIFGHKESFQPRGGQEYENRAGFLRL
ncbi:hypothetical protein GH733_010517 [Mirounga leonina]|nr:hypothetical protein GH733_010517 [Mirounga leonina]